MTMRYITIVTQDGGLRQAKFYRIFPRKVGPFSECNRSSCAGLNPVREGRQPGHVSAGTVNRNYTRFGTVPGLSRVYGNVCEISQVSSIMPKLFFVHPSLDVYLRNESR